MTDLANRSFIELELRVPGADWSGVARARLERVLNQVISSIKCSAEKWRFFFLGRCGMKLTSEWPVGAPTETP